MIGWMHIEDVPLQGLRDTNVYILVNLILIICTLPNRRKEAAPARTGIVAAAITGTQIKRVSQQYLPTRERCWARCENPTKLLIDAIPLARLAGARGSVVQIVSTQLDSNSGGGSSEWPSAASVA